MSLSGLLTVEKRLVKVENYALFCTVCLVLKNSRVCPIVCTFSECTWVTIGKSRTVLPNSMQCCAGRSPAMDLTVSASTLAARLTVSRSCSLVKLKRNMLSACR